MTVSAAWRFRPGGPRVGGQKRNAAGVPLEPVHQALPFHLGNGAVQPDETRASSGQDGLDQVQHRRPFGEENDLAPYLRREPLQEGVQLFELGRVPGRLLV